MLTSSILFKLISVFFLLLAIFILLNIKPTSTNASFMKLAVCIVHTSSQLLLLEPFIAIYFKMGILMT